MLNMTGVGEIPCLRSWLNFRCKTASCCYSHVPNSPKRWTNGCDSVSLLSAKLLLSSPQKLNNIILTSQSIASLHGQSIALSVGDLCILHLLKEQMQISPALPSCTGSHGRIKVFDFGLKATLLNLLQDLQSQVAARAQKTLVKMLKHF